MRPSFVVARDPSCSDLAYLIETLEQVRIEHFAAIRAIEALDVGVLIRLAQLDMAQLTACAWCQSTSAAQSAQGPLSQRIALGTPRQALSCSNTRTMRSDGIEVSISIADARARLRRAR